MSELDNRIREYLALKERIQELEEENERLKNRVQHLARRLRDCCSGAFVSIADE